MNGVDYSVDFLQHDPKRTVRFGEVYTLRYRDHLGFERTKVAKVLRTREASASLGSHIYPDRPRPVLMLDCEREDWVGMVQRAPIQFSFALEDLIEARWIGGPPDA